jgi:hypothetical protein
LSCELSPIREVLLASFVARFFSSQAFIFPPPIWLMLMLTPRVLGTLACVCCFYECFYRTEKLSRRLKIFSPAHRTMGDGMSLDSRQFSSSMPPQHEAVPSSHHPVHVEMPPINDDISIRSHEELARWLGVDRMDREQDG